MRVVVTIAAIFTTAARRLVANLWLVLCALLAQTVAVAIAVSVPTYAEGSSLRLLRSEIARQEQSEGRSPFALLFRYIASWNPEAGALEWERVAPADRMMIERGIAQLGLPVLTVGRTARADGVQLFPPPDAGGRQQRLKTVTLGFLSGLEPQMQLVDGALPQPANGLEAPIEVLISRAMADEVGINVGDTFSLVPRRVDRGQPASFLIRVAGIWEPLNARDPAWFLRPDSFDETILVPEASFGGPIATVLRGEVGQVAWFVRLNGSGLDAASAGPLEGRIAQLRAELAGMIPGLRLEQSPAELLARYRADAQALMVQLFVFSAPALALVFYFTALVAGLLVNRQRGEIALLKTRGTRDAQVLGIYVVEWLLIGTLALLAGPWLGLRFADLMGDTQSFLQFNLGAAGERFARLAATNYVLTPGTMAYGIVATALALAAALVPAFLATRTTLVDEQRSTARVLRPPLWQRYYLDVLLLIPPVYGIYQLQRTGGLSLGGASGADPLSNPLLVLVPVLLCFALGLLAMRLVPLLLEVFGRLAQLPAWAAPLIALRSLARQPALYRGPLLLLILTLSLAAFAASMAATMDGAMHAALAYQAGAPVQLLETGISTEDPQPPGSPGGPGQPGGPRDRPDISEEARFIFVPVQEHLGVPGVQAVARVGTYDATLQLGGVNRSSQLVGIDRLDFPQVAHFDRAWGRNQSLGGLMNQLASRRDGVLVTPDVLGSGVQVGSTLPAQLSLFGDRKSGSFTIVGVIDLWPGYYPQDGPILVANLDYIFETMGGQYPYDVWMRTDPAIPLEEIVSGVRRLGIPVVGSVEQAELIAREQARPQRQGLFGVLSVGFIAAGVLTVLGFLVVSVINARRRAIELGVLRALGLSAWGVNLTLAIEQVLLVGIGLSIGTGTGVLVAQVVVPLMTIGAGRYPGTPAFPAVVAWNNISLIYVAFGAALLLTLVLLAWLFGRLQLFQAVKLGDVN